MDKLVFSGEAIAHELKEVLAAGGRISLVVTGYSMRPFLKHERDVVYLRTWEKKDLRRGQILLFQRTKGEFVLHRIRRVRSNGKLVMNGDGQTWCETISNEQIVATVDAVNRKGQHICSKSFQFRLWNWLWYPTRMIRPVLFKLGRVLLSRREKGNGSTD